MVSAVGATFSDDGWPVVLRGILFAVDRHNARGVAGIITGQAGAVR
jgi:hypothetical protein